MRKSAKFPALLALLALLALPLAGAEGIECSFNPQAYQSLAKHEVNLTIIVTYLENDATSAKVDCGNGLAPIAIELPAIYQDAPSSHYNIACFYGEPGLFNATGIIADAQGNEKACSNNATINVSNVNDSIAPSKPII
ncbi:MAG: hypothetical protein ABH863_00705, partial [Candidatus Micrarchaeota archaeon]